MPSSVLVTIICVLKIVHMCYGDLNLFLSHSEIRRIWGKHV